MRNYLVRTPWWLRALYPGFIWRKPSYEKVVYLTFDDGPTPEITAWTLDQLKRYNAKGTFFVIGKNVAAHPGIFRQIVDAEHSIGNHTYNHLNGWNTSTEHYLRNIEECAQIAPSRLFRPPYGRIKKYQARQLPPSYKIIMWDVLSGDFDTHIDGEQCYRNVIKHVKPGSIIVFHDSVKAWPRLQVALPKILAYLKEKGFQMEAL